MTVDTLKQIFRASFDPDFITKLGHETGAFRRICDITPYNLLFALLIKQLLGFCAARVRVE